MHAIIRSQHIVNGRFNALKSCYCQRNARCICILNHKIQALPYSSLGNPNLSLSLDRNRTILFSPNHNLQSIILRNLSITPVRFDKEPLKPSSKVEETVQELKKKKSDVPVEASEKLLVKKKSFKQKFVDECVHYYHGFRLLFIDIKISLGLVIRILMGKTLTRREHMLLVRTVGDLFRLVPFSVFIVVPFLEFTLPLFIKFFPNMLPSTFQTNKEREDKIKQGLKVKLEMAKFLQQTLDNMSVQHKDHNSEQAKEFVQWFNKVRTSGEEVSNEDIMKYSKLFNDDITLDSLARNQLVALCRLLEMPCIRATSNLLRFQLRMKLRTLAADDKMIHKEGVDSLTLPELQQACRARGMRAFGVTEAKLRSQLSQWLDLSLNEKVPPSLLLLSRALMLPDTISTSDQLKATISVLPDTVLTQTKAAIGEKEGKIDNKVKMEVIRDEERKIREERKELQQEEKEKEREKKEVLVDKAPIISQKDMPTLHDPAADIIAAACEAGDSKEVKFHSKDVEVLEHAIESVCKDKKLVIEKEELKELKEEMAEYHEDVQDLQKVTACEPSHEVKESKAAQRLFKRVNKMINKMDGVLNDLESKEKQLKKDLAVEATDKKKEELVRIDDIMMAIRQIKDVPDESRIAQIKNVLAKIDDDRDGAIKVEDVLKVIEYIGTENVHLSSKQIDELIELIDKEEILEVEDKIEKALQKEKELKLEAKKEQKLETKKEVKHEAEKDVKKCDESSNSTKTSTTQSIPKVETKSSLIPPAVTDSAHKDNSKMQM